MDLVSIGRGSVGTGTDVAIVTGAAWHAVNTSSTKQAKSLNRKDAKDTKVLILFRAWTSLIVIVIDHAFDAIFHQSDVPVQNKAKPTVAEL